MKISVWLRRGLTAIAVGVATLSLIAIGVAAAVDSGILRRPFTDLLELIAERPIQFSGALHAQLLSVHPQFIAEDVTIGNPAWMPTGITAQIRRVTVVFTSPRLGHWPSIEHLEMEGAQLFLVRDENGGANWQSHAPHQQHEGELPLIRYLSMHGAKASLDDARRHLRYRGSISVDQEPQSGVVDSLQITGSGQLNDAAVTFNLIGDPLATASRTQPYHFRFEEHSDQARLSGHGELDHAYTFNHLRTTFDAAGRNLEDLYQLCGVKLINTGQFSLSGNLARDGRTTTFNNLVARSGDSDMSGAMSVESSNGRSTLTARLTSELLRTTDLGKRAAQRETDPLSGSDRMFSEVALSPKAVRRVDAVVDYRARRVLVGRLPLESVSAMLRIDHGIVTVAPLNAAVLEGRLSARLQTDAVTDNTSSSLELHLSHARLGLLDRHSEAPPRFDAPLDAEVKLTGSGTSAHQAAASANGSVNGTLGPGLIRSSLAELSAGDLRGLGMLLALSSKESALRCGMASFEAHDGTLTAQAISLDTDQVMITGEGQIDLNTEQPHLTLSGQPKSTRLLRLSSPVSVQGTLLHPKLALRGSRSLKLIDRGQPTALDCAALLRP